MSMLERDHHHSFFRHPPKSAGICCWSNPDCFLVFCIFFPAFSLSQAFFVDWLFLQAIDVLLSAGMSTPALRDIAREGVDIQRTAYSGVASSALVQSHRFNRWGSPLNRRVPGAVDVVFPRSFTQKWGVQEIICRFQPPNLDAKATKHCWDTFTHGIILGNCRLVISSLWAFGRW